MKKINKNIIRKITSKSLWLFMIAAFIGMVCMLLGFDFVIPPIFVFMFINWVLYVIHMSTYTYEEHLLGDDDDWKHLF